MDGWEWLLLAFVACWAVVWLWIAGTDPRSSGLVRHTWTFLKVILTVGGILVLVCVLFGAPSGSSRRSRD